MSASSGITTSGGKANQTGNHLEKFVVGGLEMAGYRRAETNKKQFFETRATLSGKLYHTQVNVGETIYASPRNVDVLTVNSQKFPDGLIIECKWQQATGSVDEKYPFLCENIKKTNIPTIILLDGGGYKAGAEAWLRAQVGTHPAILAVWSMQEFQIALNNAYFA